jgi:hypothetical protein
MAAAGYRSVNFRDKILWPLAYQLGLDPTIELLIDQAAALTSYINNWVRKSWDSTDWPEWTDIESFTPDPITHLVPYAYSPTDQPPTTISRVFKVYLLDPHVSQGSYDTPFRLLVDGIHCGFEHGTTVWIRFILNPPLFSSDQWDPGRTYASGELSYSPISGECYGSMIDANIGHDPTLTEGTDWAKVHFPFALVDMVLAGVYGDCLKEWGQSEKAAASEKMAVDAGQARAQTFVGPLHDRLTDQTQPKPRYTITP